MAAEQAKPRGVGRVSEDDLPYAGMLGRTRSEAVQVLMPDGSIRSLSVYTGIDAVADPALAALARAGTLHHVAEGVELALPFTYHDPVARLVRAGACPMGCGIERWRCAPRSCSRWRATRGIRCLSYARDVELVVGAHGLQARLEAGSAKLVLGRRGHAQAASARLLAERERELLRRERLIEARERALRTPMPDSRAIHDSDVEELDDQDDELYEPAPLEKARATTSSRKTRSKTTTRSSKRSRISTKPMRLWTRKTTRRSKTRATSWPCTTPRSRRPRRSRSTSGYSFG